jgi:hypothetical protein
MKLLLRRRLHRRRHALQVVPVVMALVKLALAMRTRLGMAHTRTPTAQLELITTAIVQTH